MQGGAWPATPRQPLPDAEIHDEGVSCSLLRRPPIWPSPNLVAAAIAGSAICRYPYACSAKGQTMQWMDRIGRRVKLRDLHVFLAVAQFGSMAKAADRLAV